MENAEMRPENRGQGMAITSLILGIAGMLLACLMIGIIPAIIGLVFGIIALRKNAGKGIAIAGIVTAAIGIGIFLLILIIVFGSADGREGFKQGIQGSTTTTKVVETEQTVSGEAEVTEPESTYDETTSAESVTDFHVGEYLETKNEKLTYLSCDSDFEPENSYTQPESGNKIVRLEFEYENLGKSDQSISFYSFTGYADGYKVEVWYHGDDSISGTISSGKKVKGSVYFEVPENAQEITVEYDVNFWTSEKAIFVVE